MKFKQWCVSLMLVAGSSAFAVSEQIGPRKVVNVGCHNTEDGICFVILDGAPFGSTLGCPGSGTNEFRFDNANTPAGKRAYAAMLSALLTGKNVAVILEGCTVQGSPKLVVHYVN